MTDIEWACKWVGWSWRGKGVVPLYDNEGSTPRSLPDLADAVRLRWLRSPASVNWKTNHKHIAKCILFGGPEKFIEAIREEIESKDTTEHIWIVNFKEPE